MASDTGVFISYRRDLGFAWARLAWEHLTDHGVDAFLDLESLHDAGNFDERLFNQIAARPYFVPVLVSGALERCVDEDDWLRREIEYAVSIDRVIVPLVVDGFDLDEAERCLPPEAADVLRRSNGVAVVAEYYREAMDRLRVDRLRPVDRPVRALTPEDRRFEATARRRASDTVAVPVVRAASPAPTASSLDVDEVASTARRGRARSLYAGVVALVVLGSALIGWVARPVDDGSNDDGAVAETRLPSNIFGELSGASDCSLYVVQLGASEHEHDAEVRLREVERVWSQEDADVPNLGWLPDTKCALHDRDHPSLDYRALAGPFTDDTEAAMRCREIRRLLEAAPEKPAWAHDPDELPGYRRLDDGFHQCN